MIRKFDQGDQGLINHALCFRHVLWGKKKKKRKKKEGGGGDLRGEKDGREFGLAYQIL